MRLRLLYAILICSLYSCTHEEVTRRSNFPLKPGNYWIYKTTITSSDGAVSVFPYLDSVWIEKDTIIDNKHYWEQIGTLRGTIFLRDSSDCVLMKELTYEQIIFSSNLDTLAKNPPFYKLMTSLSETVETPAGKFKAANCRMLLRKDPANTGHDDEYPAFNSEFYTTEQYICSSRVGLIKYVYYYLGSTIEYELVRYSI